MLLNNIEIDLLVDFIYATKKNRRMPWLELGIIWGVSVKVIDNALTSRGFARRLARRKAPISEKNRIIRLAWAIEHVD